QRRWIGQCRSRLLYGLDASLDLAERRNARFIAVLLRRDAVQAQFFGCTEIFEQVFQVGQTRTDAQGGNRGHIVPCELADCFKAARHAIGRAKAERLPNLAFHAVVCTALPCICTIIRATRSSVSEGMVRMASPVSESTMVTTTWCTWGSISNCSWVFQARSWSFSSSSTRSRGSAGRPGCAAASCAPPLSADAAAGVTAMAGSAGAGGTVTVGSATSAGASGLTAMFTPLDRRVCAARGYMGNSQLPLRHPHGEL